MTEHVSELFDDLRLRLAEISGQAPETVADEDNLINLGLDSIQLMMLATELRARGVHVEFADLAAEPTLARWTELVAERAGDVVPDPVPVLETADRFELSPMQYAHWIGRTDGQPFGGVGGHFYHEFAGPCLEPQRLEQAVTALLERHPMLRMRVDADGFGVLPTKPAAFRLVVHDRRDSETAAGLHGIRDDLAHRRLDLASGQVFDLRLSLLPDGTSRTHLNLDMIVADAMSLRVLLADLAQLYATPDRPLPPLGIDFPACLAAHAQRRAPARERDREWWSQRIPELPGAPALPLVDGADRIIRSSTVRRYFWLDAAQRERFFLRARARGVTPAMAAATVFAEVIGNWSAEPRFLLNLPLFDRERLHPDVDGVVGDFTNSVLLDVDVSVSMAFAGRARTVQARLHEAGRHTAYSGVEVLRDLSRAAGGDQVLAPVVYTSALNVGELFGPDFRRCFGRPEWIVSQAPQVWLDAQLAELDGGLLVNWDCLDEVFPTGLVEDMFAAYRTLFTSLVGESDTAWELPVPAFGARSAAGVPNPDAAAVAVEFARQADNGPDAIALRTSDGSCVSYGALAGRANQFAVLLSRTGVTSGELVGVSAEPTDRLAAVLGAWLCGAAATVDADPVSLRHGEHSVLIADGIRAGTRPGTIVLKSPASDAKAMGAPLAAPASSQPAIASIELTPDGRLRWLTASHRDVSAAVADLRTELGIKSDDRVHIGQSNPGAAVLLGLATLTAGASIESDRRNATVSLLTAPGLFAVTPPEGHDLVWRPLGTARCRVVDSRHRERPDFVPGDLEIDGELTGMRAVRQPDGALRVHGRSANLRAAEGLVAGHPGITSATCTQDSDGYSVVAVPAADAELVESVLARVVALNPALGDVPRAGAELAVAFGVAAEHADTHRIWLDWLAGRDVLAADPRGYRLGDRFDEVAALSHWARLTRAADGPTAQQLATLAADLPAVLRGERRPVPGFADLLPVAPDALRGWLAERLPPALRPNRITVEAPATTRFAAPEGETERAVAELWRDLLGVARVGRGDSFFALGGDSLLATRFLGRLRAAGYPDVAITELFAAPVLADFAAALLAAQPREGTPTVPADPDRRHDPFPLTAVQRAYWFGRSESMALGGVGCHFYQEFDVDDLDVARLTDALNALVARHEMLRAVVDDRGEQRILAEVSPLTIPVVDADTASALDELRDAMAHRCYDPARWPLFDIRVVRQGRRSRIGIGLDNLMLDALSVLAFYRELGQLYREPARALPPIDLSFRDYALNVRPQPTVLETGRQYWADRLDTMPPAPQLPLRADPSRVGTPRFTRRETVIDADTWTILDRRAREHGLTPSAVLLAAFAEVLGLWCGRADLTLTVTLFDRQEVHPHIDRVMGDFTSLMQVSYQPDGVADWLSRVRRLQQRLVSDLAHRAYSAIDVLRDLGRRQGEQISAMPVVFTSALGGLTELAGPAAPPFAEPVWGISQTPQVWLDHQARQIRDARGRAAVSVNWDSVEALFPDGLLDDMVAAYRTLIDWLATADWHEPVPGLLPPAQAAVRRQVNATTAPTHATLLHEVFFRLAADQPEAPAILAEDDTLCYGELADRALHVAMLLRDNGVRTGDLVGVTVAKGAAQLVAVLGVLAAGAGYVPIGVDQPSARRDRIIASAGLAGLLVDDDPPEPPEVPVWRLADAARHPALDAPAPVSPDAIAYVIFTSGSTGTPKGVEITHRAAVNTVEDINTRFGLTAHDRVLAVSALDFDLSVYDIFGPLAVGGAVVTIIESQRRDARQWAELVSRHGVTIWNTVPVMLDMLLVVLEGMPAAEPCPLRIALVSGDWVGLDLPDRLRAAIPGARLVALGGATEASIWSNAFEVDVLDPQWRSIPYGFPLRNQRYRVVDPSGRDGPDWVPGELWIGGAGVALGYRGDPDLTRQRFVTVAGERWYRTGDLGRYRPAGVLEFLGRLDNQVKLRGHRIELGEIESVLAEHDDVAQAVAVISGGRRLVAGVLPVDPARFDPAVALAWAATRLPTHMVPDRLISLDAVPLTANGKVDRAAVDRLADNGTIASEPPCGEHEHAVVRLWTRLLELDDEQRIGRDDNFFLLGGDSVLAIRFVELVTHELRADVPLPGFFAGPTIRQVAELVAAGELEEGAL